MISRIVSGLEKSISGEPALMTGPRQASLWRSSQPTWPTRPKINIFGSFIGQTLSARTSVTQGMKKRAEMRWKDIDPVCSRSNLAYAFSAHAKTLEIRDLEKTTADPST